MLEKTPQLTDEIKSVIDQKIKNLQTRREKVRLAASDLFLVYGVYPSVATIRECVGVGSFTDINADLKTFWSDLRSSGNVSIKGNLLPPEISVAFTSAMIDLWEHAMSKASESIAEESLIAKADIALARQEAQSMLMLYQGAMKRLDDSELVLKDRTQEVQNGLQIVKAQQVQIEALQASVHQLQERIKNEEDARAASELRFLSQLEQERVQLKRQEDILTGEIRFAKMQIDAARESERNMRERAKSEKENLEAELYVWRGKAKESQELIHQMRASMDAKKPT